MNFAVGMKVECLSKSVRLDNFSHLLGFDQKDNVYKYLTLRSAYLFTCEHRILGEPEILLF